MTSRRRLRSRSASPSAFRSASPSASRLPPGLLVPATALLLGVLLVVVVLVQTAVVPRLPLPGGPPDLLLVVVAAVALAAGATPGAGAGFAGGLLLDAGADHELGRTALAYTVAGCAAGLVRGRTLPERVDRPRTASVLAAVLGVAVAAVAAVAAYAATGLLLDDPRITAGAYLLATAATVTYGVLLTPLVVPPLRALVRRVQPADR